MNYYNEDTKTVLNSLKTSEKGLDLTESKSRLKKYGYNELADTKPINPLKILFNQFTNLLVIILIIAVIVSAFLGAFIDAAVILIIVILNGLFGFFQEYKAEKAIRALKQLSVPHTIVIRHGKQMKINSKELVPGDVIALRSGDNIPADCRIIKLSNLQVNESSLTGESLPVEKIIKKLLGKKIVNDQKNMLFLGTNVTYGNALAVVTKTGMQTELGKIAYLIQESEKRKTPLQKNLDAFGKRISVLILTASAIIAAVGIIQGKPAVEMFIVGVSIAVAAIPEGLPAVITITLALGLQRMASKNALVRKLPAVETLGSVSVICSDKTGTLTKNEMTVKQIFSGNELFEVTGEGYDYNGYFSLKNKRVNAHDHKALLKNLEIGLICNDSKFDEGKVIGNPTEGALLTAAGKADLTLKGKRVYDLPFDSKRKMMSVVTNENISFVKGAPEIVLENCTKIFDGKKVRKITASDKKKILQMNEKMASQALRVLGTAYKEVPKKQKYSEKELETGLTFVGLNGMIDPPREGVKEAIQICKKAGIKVMMLTGDYKL